MPFRRLVIDVKLECNARRSTDPQRAPERGELLARNDTLTAALIAWSLE
jgi:hypothetical protein